MSILDKIRQAVSKGAMDWRFGLEPCVFKKEGQLESSLLSSLTPFDNIIKVVLPV